MRTAILSDIHGNMEALREVLADVDSCGVGQVFSLGDNVGYGPEPMEVLNELNARGIPSVMGNHELALIKPSHLRWFNASAKASILITHSLLTLEAFEELRELPESRSTGDLLMVHGFPPANVLMYVFEASSELIRHELRAMREEICFVGHTHGLDLFLLEPDGEKAGGRLEHRQMWCGFPVHLPAGGRYLVNSGSVGQPRDGDNRAKWVLWDDETRTIEARCVAYDIESTARRIIARGLPEINATRLQ